MPKIIHLVRLSLFYLICYLALSLLALFMMVFGRALSMGSQSEMAKGTIRFILFVAKTMFGIRFNIVNRERLPDIPCVIMANHQSSLETLFLQLLCTPISAVLKKELLQIPILNTVFSLGRPIPIDRGKPKQAYRDLLEVGSKRLSSLQSVLIFPEGTRVKLGESARMNRGAAALAYSNKVPLVPIAHNAGLVWPPKPQVGLFPKKRVVTVCVGPVLDAGQYDVKELHALSAGWLSDNKDKLLDEESRTDVKNAAVI